MEIVILLYAYYYMYMYIYIYMCCTFYVHGRYYLKERQFHGTLVQDEEAEVGIMTLCPKYMHAYMYVCTCIYIHTCTYICV